MNVLMISLDDSVFPGSEKAGNTLERMKAYLTALRKIDPESEITSLAFTRRRLEPFSPAEGLVFIPVKAPRIQLFPAAALFLILKNWKSFHPGVITSQSPFEPGLLGVLLKALFKVPLEVQVHVNYFSDFWLREHPWWNRIRILMARLVLKGADSVRVVSSVVRDELLNRFKIPEMKVVIIPVPVFFRDEGDKAQTTSFDLPTSPGSKVVLFVGRLCFQKNLGGLFQVIEKILSARSDVEFILAGDGSEREITEKKAAHLDKERIHVLGNVDYNHLARLYRHAEVIILPSLYEGFGRVVLEGYLFGTPSVATRCGGPEDIIEEGETGFLIEINDMVGFAERVLWLLDHPIEASQFGARGREIVQERFQMACLIDKMV
ncbi:MAG: glycosyltransferase family 4 protein, partial [Anaerolineales bacterium]|nr:glycosyltransferase family 4 protein [Anaerolineales bacterium]